MASQSVKAAIKGSIASTEAADLVLKSLDATANLAEELDEKLSASPAATVAAIPTPGSATAPDCANKINAILAALTAAGIMDAN